MYAPHKILSRLLFLIIIMLAFQPSVHADQLTVQGSREALDTTKGKGYWGVRMKFNHPVFPSEFAQAITATAEGSPVPFDLFDPDSLLEPTEAGRDFLLIPKDPAPRWKGLSVKVKRGLSDAMGRTTPEFSAQFGWIKAISLIDLNTFYRSKTEKGLRFNVSSPVSERNLPVQSQSALP